jgi:hypothetical protein
LSLRNVKDNTLTMLDQYQKLYRKSVYKDNFQEYISTWKLAVAKKRLVELLPSVELGDSLETYRQRWQAQDENLYTIFVNKLLQTYDGYEALRMFSLIRNAYCNKQNKVFTDAVECLYMHLKKYPTLVSFFPPNLMRFINMLRCNRYDYAPNIIFVSSKHQLTCNECDAAKNVRFLQCVCGKNILCSGCLKSKSSKCSICSTIFTNK